MKLFLIKTLNETKLFGCMNTNTMATTEQDFKTLIIGLTERLLTAISSGDYSTYAQLVDQNLTSFEPEAIGNLVTGLDFHKFYFDNLLGKKTPPIRTSILSPVVHRLSPDSACIAYIRLTQTIDSNGNPSSFRAEETRIWHKKDAKWQMIHFHRSIVAN